MWSHDCAACKWCKKYEGTVDGLRWICMDVFMQHGLYLDVAPPRHNIGGCRRFEPIEGLEEEE